MSQTFIDILILQTLPGFLGGIVLICFNFKYGHYKNNKFIKKLSIEIIGSSITASIIPLLFNTMDSNVIIISAFCFGLCWAIVIKTVRNKITKIVEAAIGEKF